LGASFRPLEDLVLDELDGDGEVSEEDATSDRAFARGDIDAAD
jgi:hypothetical protein